MARSETGFKTVELFAKLLSKNIFFAGHTELAHELTATTDEGMRTILDIYSGLTGEVNAIKDGDEEAFKKVGGVEDEVRDAQSVCSEGRLNFRLGEPPEARFSAF